MCSVILLVQRFWEHYIPINLAKTVVLRRYGRTSIQDAKDVPLPLSKFQVSVMPAATMPILQIFLVLRTIFPIIVLNFVEQ